MTLRQAPTLDELLDDPLTQAAMRADHVDLPALRTLLGAAAGRVAASRAREPQPAEAAAAKPPIDRRAASWSAGAPERLHPQPFADACGAAFCC
jgi:hypothetical protein